jgi:hypothetical protein
VGGSWMVGGRRGPLRGSSGRGAVRGSQPDLGRSYVAHASRIPAWSWANDERAELAFWLVPLGNGIRALSSGFSAPFQAAWWYSWMRPPRTGLHTIRRSSRLTTAGTVVATALGLRWFRLWWGRCPL